MLSFQCKADQAELQICLQRTNLASPAGFVWRMRQKQLVKNNYWKMSGFNISTIAFIIFMAGYIIDTEFDSFLKVWKKCY